MASKEVRIMYNGVNTYLIPGNVSDERAEELARKRYTNGDNGDSTGSEWENITGVTVTAIRAPKTDLKPATKKGSRRRKK